MNDIAEENEKRQKRKLAERAAAEQARIDAEPKLHLIDLGLLPTAKIIVPR